jgi:ureidoacrylate peracid hydrolase
MPELTATPEPVLLDFARTAVIVVDMQNAFASKGGMFDLAGLDIFGAAGAIRATGVVTAAARAAGVPVVYLQMGFAADLSDAGDPDCPAYHKELALIMMRQRPELAGKLLVRGTWDWQIVDELRPQPGDMVIHKTRYDGFARTTLDADLKALGVRNLLFTGIATNICVESTARHGFFLDYWPILIADAVNAAGPDVTRQATLWAFENVFGWVTDSASAVATLARGVRAAAE